MDGVNNDPPFVATGNQYWNHLVERIEKAGWALDHTEVDVDGAFAYGRRGNDWCIGRANDTTSALANLADIIDLAIQEETRTVGGRVTIDDLAFVIREATGAPLSPDEAETIARVVILYLHHAGLIVEYPDGRGLVNEASTENTKE